MEFKKSKLRSAKTRIDQALEISDEVNETLLSAVLSTALSAAEDALIAVKDIGFYSNCEERNLDFLYQGQKVRRLIERVTNAALKDGSLLRESLFDVNYQPISGSFPERFETSLSAWAAEHWRPLLDQATARSPDIYSYVLSDMNGFLPTHISIRSQPPTGIIDVDICRSRNGRIQFDDRLYRYKNSGRDSVLTVHRMDGLDGSDLVYRLLFLPVSFGGRRWGDLELAYSL